MADTLPPLPPAARAVITERRATVAALLSEAQAQRDKAAAEAQRSGVLADRYAGELAELDAALKAPLP